MKLPELQRQWDRFGSDDPMWAILTDPTKRGNRWDADEFFASGTAYITSQLETISERYPDVQFDRALDFGCGLGRLSQALAERFAEVHGVDIAPSMIDGANDLNRFPDTCTYHVNSKLDLSLFDDNTFDLVLSFITLQHMKPTYAKAYIAEFLRVLKPGGVATFQVPSVPDDGTRKHHSVAGRAKRAIDRAVRRSRYRSEPVMEVYWIPHDEVLDVIARNGGVDVHSMTDQAAGPNMVSHAYYVSKR